MKYISSKKNGRGSYSSIISSNSTFLLPDGFAIWPDSLETDTFQKYKGFVILVTEEVPIKDAYNLKEVKNDKTKVTVVRSYKADLNAYNKYIEDNPDPPITPNPSKPDEMILLTAKIDSLSERNDFLEDCIAEMAGMVYNY